MNEHHEALQPGQARIRDGSKQKADGEWQADVTVEMVGGTAEELIKLKFDVITVMARELDKRGMKFVGFDFKEEQDWRDSRSADNLSQGA